MHARNDGGGTCKKASQPGTKAGITQRKRDGAAAVKVTLLSARWPGRKRGWAGNEIGGPRRVKGGFPFKPSPIFYSNLNSNSNLNPHN
jgi:hypothetical protein